MVRDSEVRFWGVDRTLSARPDFCFGPERTFVASLVISKTALHKPIWPISACCEPHPIKRVVWAALIAFAGIWREILQLIRLSFPFF